MFVIEKEFHFSASHQLDHLKDDNHQCRRLHGHNYVVKIFLVADTLDKNGFVFDYTELDFFKVWLDERFEHRHLNDVLDCFSTAENLAKYIFDYLKDSRVASVLHKVGVSETPKTWAYYSE